MPLDKDNLRKLSPEERLKRLKEMEEDRRKDVDEIEKLIRRSLDELRVDQLAERITPREASDTLSRIVQDAEEETAEAQLKREEAVLEPGTVDYQLMGQVYSSYSSLRRVLGYELSPGTLSEEQSQALDQLGEHLETVKYTTTTQQVADMANTSRELIGRIKRYAGLQNNMAP